MATRAAIFCNARPTNAGRHVWTGLRGEGRPRIASRTSEPAGQQNRVPENQVAAEQELVQQAIGGCEKSLSRLFLRYTPTLYRIAFAILRNKEDAEDAVQDGLCRAFANLRSFRGESSLSTWLISIVRNAALMALRKKRSRPETSLDELLDCQSELLAEKIVDVRPNPEQICAATQIAALVEKQLLQLPPLLQTTFRLRKTNALSVAESSRELGISPGAFKSRISRARRKLARGLQQSLASA